MERLDRQALFHLLSMIILLMMMMMMIIRQALLDLFIELARRDEESRKKRWIESTGFPFHINYVLSISILSIKSFKAEHSSCHQLSPRFTVSIRGEELSVGTKLGFTKWGLTKVDIFQD